MGLRLGNSISLRFLAFSRGGPSLNPFYLMEVLQYNSWHYIESIYDAWIEVTVKAKVNQMSMQCMIFMQTFL